MIKEIKSLSINNEVARIEITDQKIWFLICDDDICMREVTYTDFKEFLKKISYVCLTSWNKELQKKYIEFVQYFHSI